MKLAYRVFLKVTRVLFPTLLRHLVRKRHYRQICDCLVLLIRVNTVLWHRVNGVARSGRIRVGGRETKTLLCFDRVIFDKDLREIAGRTTLDIVLFHNEHYTFLANAFLSEQVRHQTYYFGTDDDSKVTFFEFIDDIILRLQEKLGFNALLNSNIIYYQDHEWSKVARKRGIPFLTLCKEVPATEKNERLWVKDWKDFPYYGDGIAVYSNWARDTLSNGCNVGTHARYEITGCPRTDAIYDVFKEEENSGVKRYVVMFDFIEYRKERLWETSMTQFLRVANEVASSQPDLRFIIKTKYREDIAGIREFIGTLGLADDNVVITHDMELTEIARNARLICGFRTTAIIKLMCSDVEVIVVNWAEALDDPDDTLITEDFSESCVHAGSEMHFYDAIQEALEGESRPGGARRLQRDELIKKNLHIIDGRRSLAFEDFVGLVI